jgi:uroporphyrin-III C-methyltransferase
MIGIMQLKQGDPSVYGRAGEEVLYFRSHGFEPIVIPGVSSALAGPSFAGIPVTQRGVAESFIVCTGVGRQGSEVTLPGYERGRTLIILMGVARLRQVLNTLLSETTPRAEANSQARRDGAVYPSYAPIAIIERASMPDQRVVTSTLAHIGTALENSGDQRPPGMIVIGWSVLALWSAGDIEVLDKNLQKDDEARVRKWLGGASWRVVEGFDQKWDEL